MTSKHAALTITYNGADKSVDYEPHAAMESVLAHARDAFGVQALHTLGLFTEDGIELKPYENSIESFGVKPGQLLVLRQSEVRGG